MASLGIADGDTVELCDAAQVLVLHLLVGDVWWHLIDFIIKVAAENRQDLGMAIFSMAFLSVVVLAGTCKYSFF